MFNFTKKNKYSFDDDVEMDDFGAYSDAEDKENAEDDVVAPVAPAEAPVEDVTRIEFYCIRI